MRNHAEEGERATWAGAFSDRRGKLRYHSLNRASEAEI